ncbi:flagellar export chaperone FliS [Curvibacter sp. CHRR-16]|uniref:flagellar export chaperone FliS n=1 Tax=Curvibacter sp. CHRR-16 TaxID=2835872 RepID=UPI001BDA55C7|nr:flagellar export chaperone FliS [Curvibacter sp. CHRR-16]MBT0569527.1 flagellar export chaperone FliS [Curvibacter sp. CHRR-16]
MYSSVNTRSAAAYKRASVEASVAMADPHQLVTLLFEALQRHLACAKLALQAQDITGKCYQVNAALRILEEGLKAPLDMERGGEIAKNLNALYDYCIRRLVLANAKNDEAGLDEVSQLIAPVASGWKEMKVPSTQLVRAA